MGHRRLKCYIAAIGKEQYPAGSRFIADGLERKICFERGCETNEHIEAYGSGGTINGHVLHHGTLLYSLDLDRMTQVLNADSDKIASKGIDSARSRVTNIREYLPENMGIRQLEDAILQGMSLIYPMTPFSLSETDQTSISKLANDKYYTWEWNYGQSPSATFCKKAKLPCGTIQAYWDEEGGHMTHVMLKGDYLFMEDPRALEAAMEGVRHQMSCVRDVLAAPSFSGMFPNTSTDELLRCFF